MQFVRLIWDETLIHHLVQGFSTATLLAVIGICVGLLTKGSDWMIDGAVQVARRTGLPRIVIGATVVSLGTTTPEAMVSVMAAWMGNPGLALGNGVGSIIADTGLIFGLSCMLSRIPVNRFILDRTGWVQVGVASLLVGLSVIFLYMSNGKPVLHRWVGVLFLVLLMGYLYLTYIWAKQEYNAGRATTELNDLPLMGWAKCWFMLLGGLLLVIASARFLVPCAAQIAYRFGVPDDVIAATMVALGTSLPELMTAMSAIRRGHPEIAVGNVVGADVLNCLFVIGAATAARPLLIPINFFVFHFPAMLLILYLFRVFIFINTDGWFKKWQGGCLLGVYLLYLVLQYVFNFSAAG